MAYDVVFASSAARRLDETIDFLKFVCCNAKFSTKLLDDVKAEVLNLRTKEGFHIVDHAVSDFVGETVYRIRLGSYRLVYKVDRTNNRYIIFLFMHDSQPLDISVMRDYESAS